MKINTDELIKAASRQLGMSEDTLRDAVKSGNINEIKKHLGASDAQKLDSALKDRGLAENIRKKYGG